MADSTGGALNMIGITPSFVASTVTTGVSTGVSQSFQGVGSQSLITQAGQAVVSSAASNVVNVGINSLLGTEVASASGLSLDTGANVLASTVTPYVTSSLAGGVNQAIQTTLSTAGPIGPVLSEIGTGVVNQAFNGLTNAITGATTPGTGGGGTKTFPGAGYEPDANYNGAGAYTLGTNGPDVIFSIRPANSGASDYLISDINSPFTSTSLSLPDFTDVNGLSAPVIDGLKYDSMQSGSIDISSFMSTDISSLFTSTDTIKLDSNYTFNSKGIGETGWTFICAPEGIEWTTANAVNRVDIFGTNSPPAISGTRGMREFNLTNALVEGFTRNKTVEAKVAALEDLLSYKSSLEGGYVNVPVYQVWANQKGYCSSAYWVLKSVKVKETMRDLTGNSTRAYVDVSFVEVPAYQVDSGMDQAPFSNMGAGSGLVQASLKALDVQAASVANGAQQGLGTTKSTAGPLAASPAPANAGGGGSQSSTSQVKPRNQNEQFTRIGEITTNP